jgi:hypothetical protein
MAKIEIDDKLYDKFKSYIDEEKLNEKEEVENLVMEYIKTKKLLKFVKENKN